MRTVPTASIVLLALTSGLALAQPAADEKPLPIKTLISFRRAPLAEIAQHPKDAGLRRALAMLPDRVEELPEESMDQFPTQGAEAVTQVLGLIAAPCRFAIIYNPSSTSGGAFGYGVVASSLLGEAGKPQRLQGLIEDAIQMSGNDLPSRSRTRPDMREVRTPGGRLVFGPRTFDSGAGFEATFGTVEDPDAPFATIPEPSIAGLKPFVTGTFDFSALTPAANAAQMAAGQAAAGEGQKMPNLVKELSDIGYIGEQALKGSFEWGTAEGTSRFRVRVENAEKVLAASGLGEGRLTAAHFAAIPADAVSATVGLFNTDSLLATIQRVRDQGVPVDDVLGRIEEMTGVDVENDVVAAIGGASVMYASDSTGGGGLLSYVVLMGLKDAKSIAVAHDKFREAAARFLAQAAEEPDGAPARYIRIRAWKTSGQSAFSLTFPGVPIPLEVSWALTDKWLVVGLTPQAVAAAVAQSAGKGDAGLLSRRGLAMTDFDKRRTLSWSFGDTGRLLRDGYGVLTMLGSGIANGVRSPAATEREPGMVVPPYGELMADVKPSVSAAYVDGGVLFIDSISDPSLLVNMGAAAGGYGKFLPILGLIGAGAAGAERSGMDLSRAVPTVDPVAFAVGAMFDAVEGPLGWFSGRRGLGLAMKVMPEESVLVKP